MNIKKIKKIISLLTVASISLVSLAPNVYASDIQKTKNIKRLWGDNRFLTSVSISKEGWEQSDNVLIATGSGNDKFADALASVSLSKSLNAPLLLSQSTTLPKPILEEIQRLKAKNIYLLGGTGVLSDDIEKELINKNYKVTRLGGQNRYETAVNIGQEVNKNFNVKKAYITTGTKFQPSMAAASKIGHDNGLLLFTDGTSLNSFTKKALKDWKIEEVSLIGSNKIICNEVETELKNSNVKVERIEGNNAKEITDNVLKTYDTFNGALIANNNIFADSLSGSALSAKLDYPILLTDNNNLADYKINDLKNLYICGGAGAISENIENTLNKRNSKDVTTTTNTIGKNTDIVKETNNVVENKDNISEKENRVTSQFSMLDFLQKRMLNGYPISVGISRALYSKDIDIWIPKSWRDEKTINNNNIYVTDIEEKEIYRPQLKIEGDDIIIPAPKGGFKPYKYYNVVFTTGVKKYKSKDNEPIFKSTIKRTIYMCDNFEKFNYNIPEELNLFNDSTINENLELSFQNSEYVVCKELFNILAYSNHGISSFNYENGILNDDEKFNRNKIYILDKNNNKIKCDASYGQECRIIDISCSNLTPGEEYTLVIEKGLRGSRKRVLKHDVTTKIKVISLENEFQYVDNHPTVKENLFKAPCDRIKILNTLNEDNTKLYGVDKLGNKYYIDIITGSTCPYVFTGFELKVLPNYKFEPYKDGYHIELSNAAIITAIPKKYLFEDVKLKPTDKLKYISCNINNKEMPAFDFNGDIYLLPYDKKINDTLLNMYLNPILVTEASLVNCDFSNTVLSNNKNVKGYIHFSMPDTPMIITFSEGKLKLDDFSSITTGTLYKNNSSKKPFYIKTKEGKKYYINMKNKNATLTFHGYNTLGEGYNEMLKNLGKEYAVDGLVRDNQIIYPKCYKVQEFQGKIRNIKWSENDINPNTYYFDITSTTDPQLLGTSIGLVTEYDDEPTSFGIRFTSLDNWRLDVHQNNSDLIQFANNNLEKNIKFKGYMLSDRHLMMLDAE